MNEEQIKAKTLSEWYVLLAKNGNGFTFSGKKFHDYVYPSLNSDLSLYKVNEPAPMVIWVNIYNDGDMFGHKTKDGALEAANNNSVSQIKTIKFIQDMSDD